MYRLTIKMPQSLLEGAKLRGEEMDEMDKKRMKLIGEREHPIDRAVVRHPEIFTEGRYHASDRRAAG
jgi:hypothetical protein